VPNFKYLGTAVIDTNCIHEDIKSKLNSGNAGYHSVQSILSYCLLSKNSTIKIYKKHNFTYSFYEYEIWTLRLREDID